MYVCLSVCLFVSLHWVQVLFKGLLSSARLSGNGVFCPCPPPPPSHFWPFLTVFNHFLTIFNHFQPFLPLLSFQVFSTVCLTVFDCFPLFSNVFKGSQQFFFITFNIFQPFLLFFLILFVFKGSQQIWLFIFYFYLFLFLSLLLFFNHFY